MAMERSSLASLFAGKDTYLLPFAVKAHQNTKFRIRTLLSHCLYRRVIFWGIVIVALLCLSLTTTSRGDTLRRARLLELTKQHGGEDAGSIPPDKVVVAPEPEQESHPHPWRIDLPSWLGFRHLDGYFVGLKALVPAKDHKPEFPLPPNATYPFPTTLHYTGLPTPTPFIVHPDYESSDYAAEYYPVSPCYLDANKTIPIPDIYAYNGIPQGQPNPFMGSHKVLGLRDDVCFDRFGRYGPYGLGYSFDEGGLEVGMDTESAGSEVVWERTGKINYAGIDWGEVQNRCYEANKQRFVEVAAPTGLFPAMKTKTVVQPREESAPETKKKMPRTAVVVRAYTGFPWSAHLILNLRALISELALRSGAEYDVHFLLHVRDDSEPILADPRTVQRILDENIPPEFHGLCTVWSEEQMRVVYPGGFKRVFSNPARKDIYGVYRSAHFALQYFAFNHPEYDFFWNWEMDMRFVGNYYELFDRLGRWARNQSRVGLWERSSKYYIPQLHGDWDNFTAVVERDVRASGRPFVLGPQNFAGREPLLLEQEGQSFMPPSCAGGANDTSCGVGEDADLITFNPLFDPEGSGWFFESDMAGYDTSLPKPPRRCSIITAGRFSRRMLMAMHEEVWRLHHTAFTEMFPATVALHRGLKAVFAPHPVSIDRDWDLAVVEKTFNGGRDHTTSGRGSVFNSRNEHNHKGTSWYYHSEFSGLLWRRWLGYAEWDGRGPNGGKAGEGTLRGGREEEEMPGSTGRMCLRSLLVHPIKWEHPSELEEEDD
ncbi:hypothetical protein VTJ83DRAFT_3556 [Remersonia thermophila]|uniref:Uncharacterized protein n=1 Tax=Remersonia thermophila TaxID=72144 RepID=A0ABR4DEX7_9PEZI